MKGAAQAKAFMVVVHLVGDSISLRYQVCFQKCYESTCIGGLYGGNDLGIRGSRFYNRDIVGVSRQSIRHQRFGNWHSFARTSRIKLQYAAKLAFTATNNVAQYEIVIIALKIVKEVGIHNFIIYIESQLVVNQYQKQFKVSDLDQINYEEKFHLLLMVIKEKQGNCKLRKVARGKNGEADLPAKMAAIGEKYLTQLLPFEGRYPNNRGRGGPTNQCQNHEDDTSLQILEKGRVT